MKTLRQIPRVSITLSCIFSYIVTMVIILIAPLPRGAKFWLGFQIPHQLSKLVLKILDIRVEIKNFPGQSTHPQMVVCNHLSYIDIVAMFSSFPATYITSVEIRDTPVLGHICRLAGCVFVERRNKEKLQEEIEHVASRLQETERVILFPEGTSGDGRQVLPFKRSFFSSAIHASADLQPVVINYRARGNDRLPEDWRDSVFWYGRMRFFPHLMDLAKLDGVDIDIQFLESRRVSTDTDPKGLRDWAFSQVQANYHPV